MVTHILSTEFILYVHDQEKSMQFYSQLLRQAPVLHVPGMTEFQISEHIKLGLMPNAGIAKIIQESLPHPQEGTGIPRCECYFTVEDVSLEFEHALSCGAQLISPIEERDWGARVCYFADPDGHILAFAQQIDID